MKKVLHINSDFLYTNIYNLMYSELTEYTEKQLVYSAVKKKSKLSFCGKKFDFVLSPILKKYDSLFFHNRINISINQKSINTIKNKIFRTTNLSRYYWYTAS